MGSVYGSALLLIYAYLSTFQLRPFTVKTIDSTFLSVQHCTQPQMAALWFKKKIQLWTQAVNVDSE